ncbi:MAG: adenylate/guanylate cyclase domain-containing protein [Spirochaetales bacterium]|nr:adenylate/guanylate cyclase domain-containing protein [Spirochaetales bacterium]
MEKKKKGKIKLFETKYFGFILGIIVIIVLLVLGEFTTILSNLETSMLDIHFNYKNIRSKQNIQEGVSLEEANPNISPDVLIVGVDFRSLDKFGKWPFPRWRHADFLKSLARIKNQNDRESSVLLDLFFIEPDADAVDDGLLIDAIAENDRVFLETILDEVPPPAASRDEYFARQQILYDNYGKVQNIVGDWTRLPTFYGLQPPLQPYARATFAYGHANYFEDQDQIYRRQPMIVKSAFFLEEIKLDDLTVNTPLDYENHERIEWVDQDSRHHNIDFPFTDENLLVLREQMVKNAPLKSVDTNNDGEPDESYYVVNKYQDHFIPAITLTLALKYFNRSLSEIEIVLGEYIFIPQPEHFNTEIGEWEAYRQIDKYAVYNEDGEELEAEVSHIVEDIKIPIDDYGRMLINFMGPASFATPGSRQTFPVRSYSGYASNPPSSLANTWPRTKALGNKIVLVGAFARGIAEDQKTTPYGLMYGIEIHANALNTILMSKFLTTVPYWQDVLLLIALVLIVSLLTTRIQALWSFVINIVVILGLFFATTIIFEHYNLIVNFATPAIGMILSFLSIVAYRAMTEERDKRMIKSMFGTYLSPKVVDQILDSPPELGGLDKNLTVFFSDIRGFTTLSESMSPQELVKILNRYLSVMTDNILELDGTLDKYEGDAIMAFWGAPLPEEDHAFLACKSSVMQIAALKELNKEFPDDKQINIGIGLNSGIMTVGNMGSTQRMDYTLIGDNVNLGARLEGTNKAYGTRIIISEFTYDMVKDRVIARELDNIRVKGKNKPVLIYELLDYIEDEVDEQ